MGRRTSGTPQDPGYSPPPQTEKRLIYRRAENGEMVAYTPAEYGVRKDDGLGMIEPYSSSGGLLVLAILLTIGVGVLVWITVRVVSEGSWHFFGEVWWVYPTCLYLFIAAWHMYFKERRAEELRDAHNLPRPVE